MIEQKAAATRGAVPTAIAAAVSLSVASLVFQTNSRETQPDTPSDTPPPRRVEKDETLIAEQPVEGRTPLTQDPAAASTLEIPEIYRPAFEVLPEPLRSEVVKRIRQEFSDPNPTTPAQIVRVITDSMAQAGYAPREIVRTVESFLRFGALPHERTAQARAELVSVFPELVRELLGEPQSSPESFLSSGLNISWFNSANDPFPDGFSRLVARRQELGDPVWIPEDGTQLAPEVWVSAFPFSRSQQGVSPGDHLALSGEMRVYARSDEQRISPLLKLPVTFRYDEAEQLRFTTHKVTLDGLAALPTSPGNRPSELILHFKYSLTHVSAQGAEDGSQESIVQRGEVFLALKPAEVALARNGGDGGTRLVGYSFEPLGPDGKPLEVPGLAEGFVRTAILNMLDLRKEPLRNAAEAEQRAADIRAKMLNQPLPEIGVVAEPPADTGFANLPRFGAPTVEGSPFAGTVTTSEQLRDILKGKITLLDFWTTWCGPCIQSIPTNNTLHEGGNVQVVGLLDGAHPRNLRNLEQVIVNKEIHYPIAVIDKDTLARFGGTGYPFYVLVDWRQGEEPKVVWSRLGTNHTEMQGVVDQLTQPVRKR